MVLEVSTLKGQMSDSHCHQLVLQHGNGQDLNRFSASEVAPTIKKAMLIAEKNTLEYE